MILFHDMILWDGIRRDLCDRLLGGRIEGLTDAFDGFDAEFCQRAHELFQRQLHTLCEGIDRTSRLRRFDRPLKVVDHRQQFFENLFIAELDLFSLVALSQPLVVVELSRQSQVFFVEGFAFVSLGIQGLLTLICAIQRAGRGFARTI